MRIRTIVASGAAAVVLSAAVVIVTAPASTGATGFPAEGIACESGSGTYALSTATGRITMPDGNSVYSWGYRTTSRNFQLPGPILCVNVGQPVTITLTNTLTEDTSLVFPGIAGVRADGDASLPVMDASATPPRVTSLAPVAGKNGGTVTYTFTPTKPGTYLYESGTNPAKQVEMGLYGALIVYPTSSSSGDPRAYDSADTQFQVGREFIHILSEVDPAAHLAVEQNKPFDWTTYAPKYFLLNGRSAPDTVAPNGAPWLPSQPYGAMVHVQPFVKDLADPGDHEPALVRYLNVSRTDVAFHPHGNTEHVVAEDASPLVGAGPGDHSYGSFLVDVGANRTVDALFTWEDAEGYSPASPLPVEVPGFQDLMIKGTWYSMSPYLGQTGVLPGGQASFNQCGEYYHMAHNHNLSKATNYGVSFGGQMTLIRIDPANGC